jgi:L-ascorbate metabolism protein UlaG (beta-lactamase superfamily)
MQQEIETDIFRTANGKVEITFIGHGSLMFVFQNLVLHVDPFSDLMDYTRLPKGDVILLTHQHRDHLDQEALNIVRSEKSVVVLTEACARQVLGGIVMNNGDVRMVAGLKIEAVPAYNIIHRREDGSLFHPKGMGNGYIINFEDKRVYVAGDTENIPEMKAFKEIDVAFLPMNLPYTMTPEMVAQAAKMFKPKILYPYHYGQTDTSKISYLLKDTKEIEIRIRKME